MIWFALFVLVFFLVWLTAEITDELRFVWRNGRVADVALVAVLVVGVGCVTLWIALAALNAYWTGP